MYPGLGEAAMIQFHSNVHCVYLACPIVIHCLTVQEPWLMSDDSDPPPASEDDVSSQPSEPFRILSLEEVCCMLMFCGGACLNKPLWQMGQLSDDEKSTYLDALRLEQVGTQKLIADAHAWGDLMLPVGLSLDPSTAQSPACASREVLFGDGPTRWAFRCCPALLPRCPALLPTQHCCPALLPRLPSAAASLPSTTASLSSTDLLSQRCDTGQALVVVPSSLTHSRTTCSSSAVCVFHIRQLNMNSTALGKADPVGGWMGVTPRCVRRY